MTKKRIGVVRGGAGEHYTSSLKKGGDVILHIQEALPSNYDPVDILIDKNHIWHCNGIPINPSELVSKIDVAWNTAHPSLSNILESLNIPNLGVGSFAGTMANNRDMLKTHMKSIGVNMPRHIILPAYQADFDGPRERYAIKKAKEVFEKFGAPWIVRSFTPDESMGIHLAQTFGELAGAIDDGMRHNKSILIEEFIAGKVGAVHSTSLFRKDGVYTFPMGKSASVFSGEEKEKLINITKEIHKHIGAKHYLKSDLVLSPTRGVFLLGVDLVPDLRKDSHFCEACESAGLKPEYVTEHLVEGSLWYNQ